MSEPLDSQQINAELEKLPGWKYEKDRLHKAYRFGNFTEAMAFLVQVGFLAESHNHHPGIENVYNSVTLTLQTHDSGNVVTTRDIALAAAIESLTPTGLKT